MKSNPWDNITISKYKHSINGFLADKNNLIEFFWAKDLFGNFLFVVHTKSTILVNKIPKLQGIDIEINQINDNETQVILKLLSKNDKDIFYTLCKDLLNSTKNIMDENIAVKTILKRLEKWQFFLKNRRKPIDKRQLKGLIGELYFIEKYLFPNFDVKDILDFWKAPLDSVHDFEISNTTVEVKTKSSVNSITISSYEQMLSELDNLYLFVVGLNESSKNTVNSITIYNIIDKIQELILERNPLLIEKFEILLINYGFIPLDEYKDLYFVIISDEFYEVKDNFPKIENIPNGIEKLTYRIDLNSCREFLVKKDIFKDE